MQDTADPHPSGTQSPFPQESPGDGKPSPSQGLCPTSADLAHYKPPSDTISRHMTLVYGLLWASAWVALSALQTWA